MRIRQGLPVPFRALIALLAVALLLGGCAGNPFTPARPGPPIPAPTLQVGDRWVYHVVDGYRWKAEWDETHEVVAIDANGITVQVTLRNPTGEAGRTEKWPAPGVVVEGAVYEAETDRFEPPLIRYRYPLTPGTSWSQRIRDAFKPPPTPYGPIVRQVNVAGYDTVTTPAGTFEAMRLDVFLTLDDETFWRWGTECTYTIWYSEAVGASVREVKRSTYRDKGDFEAAVYHPGQNALVELVSFSRR